METLYFLVEKARLFTVFWFGAAVISNFKGKDLDLEDCALCRRFSMI